MIRTILLIALTIGTLKTYASSPTFQDLSKDDFKGVIQDFSSVFVHTSVSPASSLGKIFGFELGLVAGAAQTPEVKKLAQEADPNSNISMLPSAGVLGVVSLPLGISAEAVLLPEADFSDVTLSNTSLALKWTFTEILPLPFDMALKAHHTVSEMKFSGQVSGVNTHFKYENAVSGVLVQASKKLTIFEPYVGVGAVKTTGKMKVDSNLVFDPSYTAGQSAEESITSAQFFAGANFNLLVLKLGMEVGRVFDSTRGAAKVSFYF